MLCGILVGAGIVATLVMAYLGRRSWSDMNDE